MKKAVKAAGIISSILIVCFYILSSAAPYISPVDFSFITLFSIIYLPVLACYILLMIAWFFFRKKTALLLFILLFAGYKNLFSNLGIHFFSSSWKHKKDNTSIRVMSWNVNLFANPWRENDTPNSIRRQMLGFISHMQPDVLCLQDLRQNELKAGRSAFVDNISNIITAGDFKSVYYFYYYDYNGINYSDKTGVAIFSKLPVKDTGSIFTSGYLKDEKAGYIDIAVNGRALRIFTVHFSSMSLWPSQEDEAGFHYIDKDSSAQRSKNILSKIRYFGKIYVRQAVAVKAFLNRSPYPVIFAADINSVPSGYVYHYLKKGLNDAFLENGFGIGGTYNRVFPRLRIDILFHSKELEAVQFVRPIPDLSDHYPLIADIKWKE